MNEDEERPKPFVGATRPSAYSKAIDYKARLEMWFRQLAAEEDSPNEEQLGLLRIVHDRLLIEIRLEKLSGLKRKHQPQAYDTREEEPLRALVHGLPGTGKSRVIK